MSNAGRNQHLSHWLAAYHDGELSPRERRRVDAHLTECDDCRAELAQLQGLSQALQNAAPVATTKSPARFGDEVTLQLARRAPVQATPPRLHMTGGWLVVPLLLAAVLALLQSSVIFAALQHWLAAQFGITTFWPLQLLSGPGIATCAGSLGDAATLLSCATGAWTATLLGGAVVGLYLVWLLLWWFSHDTATDISGERQ